MSVSKKRQANINRIKWLLNPADWPSLADDNLGIVFLYRMRFNYMIVMEMIQLA